MSVFTVNCGSSSLKWSVVDPGAGTVVASGTVGSVTDHAAALDGVAEVVEVLGLSGEADLLVQVVARDADDLYRIAGHLLATDGVERTTTSLVMRRLVEHLEESQVRRARALGWSWQEIAEVLGVSRQAVHKKHGRH